MDSEISLDDLRSIVPKIKRALNKSSGLLAQEVWGNLMDFSPQDTGRLAGSWRLEQQGPRLFIIGSNVEYALVQNYGSDPYEIYPRQAQALRFEINGQVIFAKSVSHPGIQGTFYIEGSIAAAEKRIPEFVEMGLEGEGLI